MSEQTPATTVDLIQVENPEPVPVEFVSFPLEKRDPDVDAMREAGLPIEQAVVAANVALESIRKVDIEDRQKRVNQHKKLSQATFERDEAMHVAEKTQTTLENSRVDNLTGFRNQTAYKEFVEALDHRNPTPGDFGILVIDADHLKAVNDKTGSHRLGNKYLSVIANALSGQMRQTDAIFRTGGDEFVVVLDRKHDKNDDHNGSELSISDRIREAVSLAIAEDEELAKFDRLGVSVGYASNGTGSLYEAEKVADLMMYDDKTFKKAQYEKEQLESRSRLKGEYAVDNFYHTLAMWFSDTTEDKSTYLKNTATRETGASSYLEELRRRYPGIVDRLSYIFGREQARDNTLRNRGDHLVVHDVEWYKKAYKEKQVLTQYAYHQIKKIAEDAGFNPEEFVK